MTFVAPQETSENAQWSANRFAAVPGPNSPALWQTIRWMMAPKAYIDMCRKRYGKTFYIDVIGWGRLVMTSEPQLVQEALTNRNGAYSVAAANSILEPVVGKYSLFVRDGDDHGIARAQVRTPLGASALVGYRPWLAELSQEYLERVNMKPSALRDEVRRYCMAAMIRLCFGKSDIGLVKTVIHRIGPVLGIVPSTLAFIPALHKDRGPLSPVRYLKYRLARFDDLLNSQIEEALREERSCLATHVGTICGATSATPEIRDQVATALVAGFEATASAIEWLLYWVFSNPEIVPELRKEVNLSGERLNIDGPVLDSVCKEALRLSPPVDFYPRQLIGGFGDRTLLVAPCSLTMHREPEVFSRPEEFCPSRFRDQKFANHQYSVYGGGQWRCPGEGFSQIAMKSFLAELIANYEVSFSRLGKPKWRRKTIVLIPGNLRISKLRKISENNPSIRAENQ